MNKLFQVSLSSEGPEPLCVEELVEAVDKSEAVLKTFQKYHSKGSFNDVEPGREFYGLRCYVHEKTIEHVRNIQEDIDRYSREKEALLTALVDLARRHSEPKACDCDACKTGEGH